jgi:putative redox protein
MADAKPPLKVELVWSDDLKFGATTRDAAFVIDGDGVAGPSPVQMLGTALVGCMASDIVDIIRKGRHPLSAFHATLTGERAPEPPRRITRAELHFAVHGDIPPAAVERAIALSREKYCSVWHSLRQDIELTATFDIHP